MEARNTTREALELALAKTNAVFGGNIEWKRSPEPRSVKLQSFVFTLRAKSSRAPGHVVKRSPYRERNIPAACWHVHGLFFDTLLEANPNAEIRTALARINKNGGNWKDYNVGSAAHPVWASESCNCIEDGLSFRIGHPRFPR